MAPVLAAAFLVSSVVNLILIYRLTVHLSHERQLRVKLQALIDRIVKFEEAPTDRLDAMMDAQPKTVWERYQ